MTNVLASDGTIRVVVQNGEYWLCNKGDLAMLDVTVRRLRGRWPTARIGVITSAGPLLRAFHPGTEPLDDRGPGGWPGASPLSRLAERAGPRLVGGPTVTRLTARELPRGYARRAAQRLRRRPSGAPTVAFEPPVPAALPTASLVLAMGGGYLADVDPDQVHRTLNLLEHAADRGIPTAMVGQGLGPLEDPVLRARAAAVLPRVDLIALREAISGPALLNSLGVPAERVVVTGDDAIELAHGVRRDELGSALGVCLRVADYSPVGDRTRDAVRRAVQGFAREANSALVPLIISEYRSEDRRSTLPLVAGYARAVRPLDRYATPQELASRVANCRVLVTGAYHLGVFALSQGIPVVGLSSSRYYDDKLYGLNGMFGGGLQVVRLDEPDLETRIVGAVRTAWADAPAVRSSLRERAAAQIELSRQAFNRVFDLVEHTRTGTPDRG